MRHAGIIVLSIVLLLSCSAAEFTSEELELIDELSFDAVVIKEIKDFTAGSFMQYEVSDPGFIYKDGKAEKTGIVQQSGITFALSSQKSWQVLDKFKFVLGDKGYRIFISEMDYSNNINYTTVIKTEDQFDILRFEKTDGINYDIENEQLIQKLQEWNKKYGIIITGADYDWVQFDLITLPDDIMMFAKEVYEFCPDSVDQGVGSLQELVKEIIEYKMMFLWWD